ncbi:MAG TPA: amidohydrolase [Polyangiaceae bacterium]|nr:amidohydrolase [Polyangiaceae bacterium]
MPLTPEVSAAIDHAVDACAGDLLALSRRIHAHPELRFEEHKASGWIADFLVERGHAVERGLAGMPTAVRSRSAPRSSASGGRRPCAAILAEYDALPGVGHACGHNLIAAAAAGGFVAAAAVADAVGGEVVLLGTPAEEGGGGKIEMIKAGVFDAIDAAMMFHPFDRDLLMHPTLASLWIVFEFRGTPSHAAAAPHAGASALTACLDTFRLIDGQRVHFRDGVRVHGFVTNGGQAVNIIPERAACEFSVRASDGSELERVRAIVERCARAAAMASDVEISRQVRAGYRDMVTNEALAHCFGAHLQGLGRSPRDRDPRVGTGSTDMGDVSHVVPSIHPWLAIVEEGAALCHEHRFGEAAATDGAGQTALVAAKALARTAIEFLADGDLRAAVTAEWRRRER